MRNIGYAACALALIWGAEAAAQANPEGADPAPPLNASQTALVHQRTAVQGAGPSTPDKPVTNGSAVAITAAQDNSSASVTVSFPAHFGLLQVARLTASAPINQGANAADVASLDGLAKGFSVKLDLSGWSRGRRTNFRTFRAQVTSFCSDFWAGNPDLKRSADGLCSYADIAKAKDATWFDSYENLFYQGPIITWALTASGGSKQFKFYDPNSLAAQNASKAQWSVGAYAAVQPAVRAGSLLPILLTASYQHQRTFADADAKTLCPASSGGAAPLACVNGPIGVPVLTTKDLAALEFRCKPAANFAFAVTGTYDAKAKVWGVEAPLYLVGDGKSGLAGGVRVGWRSDTRAVTAGVFVSKAFDLVPGA